MSVLAVISALFVVICCLKHKVEELEIFSFIFFQVGTTSLFAISHRDTPGGCNCAAGCTFSSTIYQSLNIMGAGGLGSETQAAYTQKKFTVVAPPPPPT